MALQFYGRCLAQGDMGCRWFAADCDRTRVLPRSDWGMPASSSTHGAGGLPRYLIPIIGECPATFSLCRNFRVQRARAVCLNKSQHSSPSFNLR